MEWMANEGKDASSPHFPLPRLIVASPVKFLNYVLVPGHPSGKDRIFLGRLGYRPRNEEDARTLAATYMEQARRKLEAGDVVIGEADEYGRRVVIAIEIRGALVRSAWLLRPDGTFDLVTPFTGFVRQSRERSAQ
jgi:hypothetical protein